MNIEKIGNKFKKHGVTVYSAKKYNKIVIYNDVKDPTDPLITTLLLIDNKLVVECVGNAETPGYHQVLTNQRDVLALLSIYYQYVKTKVKLQDIPLKIQENIIAHSEAKAAYFDGTCDYTVSVRERDSYVLFNGKYIKAGNLEFLKGLRLRVNTVTFDDCMASECNRRNNG